MAVLPNYQTEIDEVDATKTITYNSSGSGYGEFEFSYSDPSNDGNYTVVGGSEVACQHGAAVLLYNLGYRFFGAQDQYIVRPSSITTGLSLSKRELAITGARYFCNGSFAYYGAFSADGTTLIDEFAHWTAMVGAYVYQDIWPNGHAWQTVISDNSAFFTANPSLYTGTIGSATASFPLDVLEGTSGWDDLVAVAAQWLWTKCNANAYKRYQFDPTDGSTLGTELTVAFTEDVIAAVRAGPAAISGYGGIYPSRAALPTAQCGIYGYSDHFLPPENVMSDGIYVQVTNGFFPPGYTIVELFQGWVAKSQNPVSIYNYINLYERYDGMPMDDPFSKYGATALWTTLGIKTFVTEFSPNWVPAMLYTHEAWLRTMDADATTEDAITDLMANLFDDDPLVEELYRLWYQPYTKSTRYTLKESFDLVDAMSSSWYKTMFQQYLTIQARWFRLPPASPVNDAYRDLLSLVATNSVATRMDGIRHDSRFIQLVMDNGVPLYPEIDISNSPSWYTSPVAPDATDFAAEHAILTAQAVRDANLDDTTLVLLSGLESTVSGQSAKSQFRTQNALRMVYCGPGTLTRTSQTNGVADIVTTYGAGFHEIVQTDSDFIVTWDGGALFINGYDKITWGNGSGNSFLWVQPSAAGEVYLESGNVAYLADESGNFILYANASSSYTAPSNLGPGVIGLGDASTLGDLLVGNINPYISADPEYTAVPLDLVVAEYPGLIKCTLV